MLSSKFKIGHFYYSEWDSIDSLAKYAPKIDLFRVINIEDIKDSVTPFGVFGPFMIKCIVLASNDLRGWWSTFYERQEIGIKAKEVFVEDFPLFIGLKYKDSEFLKVLKGET